MFQARLLPRRLDTISRGRIEMRLVRPCTEQDAKPSHKKDQSGTVTPKQASLLRATMSRLIQPWRNQGCIKCTRSIYSKQVAPAVRRFPQAMQWRIHKTMTCAGNSLAASSHSPIACLDCSFLLSSLLLRQLRLIRPV